MTKSAGSSLLHFTINPSTVFISTNPDQSSYADINITVENTGTEPVKVNSLAISLPPALAPARSLGSIIPVAGNSKVWSFVPSDINPGEFDAMSQNSEFVSINLGEFEIVSENTDYVAINPGDLYQFTLKMVTLVNTISRASANVTVLVTLDDGSTMPEIQLNVAIAPAVATVHFNSEPANINPGESSLLKWTSEGIDYCIISVIDKSHRAASGSLPVNPITTTIYTLYAYGAGIILSAQWAISVDNPQIVSFSGAGGLTSVNYGDMLTLVWKCNQFTQSILLINDSDVTIPPLLTGHNTVQQGSVSLGPIVAPTMFTFTAYGTDPQNFDQRNPTIDINDVKATFTASPDSGLWEKDKVTLSWDIISASEITLTPPIEDGPSLQNLSGSAVIYPESDVTYTLTVNGFTRNIPGQLHTAASLTNIQQVAINSFTINPPLITPETDRNSITLGWNCIAPIVSIDNGIGTVNPVHRVGIRPPDTGTVYNLTAGTLQNPNLQTAQVIAANACGPYTFTSFSINPAMAPGLNLFLPHPDPVMKSLRQGFEGQYLATIDGVNIMGVPSSFYIVAFPTYVENDPEQSYFAIIASPYTPDAFSLEWSDPNKPQGTITVGQF